ncbi:MAG: hypothetical protein VX427_16765 [Acidobacteriota bacterium]|nr:hypothetical protein [Acidobacteriota bacterium]
MPDLSRRLIDDGGPLEPPHRLFALQRPGVDLGVAGEYWLRAEALDSTGDGGSGFQCCWTSAVVQVTVSE